MSAAKATNADTGERLDAETLFRRHADFAANFLHRLGAPAPEIDDLVQEVFLVAHRRGGFVQCGAARPTTWLAEIAIRVASVNRRRTRRSKEDPATAVLSQVHSDDVSAVRVVEANEAMRRVQRALDCLDDEKRAAFILYELEGESCSAIAAGLGIPVGTVYSRLHKARKEFMKAHERLLKRERPPVMAAQARVAP
jgi:RNA polymerase sigma-70 factor (ECF subfamily)